MSRRLRYGRRLAVVGAIIAAIVGAGFLWRASSAASLVADGHDGAGDGGRLGRPSAPGEPPDGERFRRGDGGAFDLGNLDDLGQTMIIGGAVMAVVVVIDRSRRRRHPVRG